MAIHKRTPQNNWIKKTLKRLPETVKFIFCYSLKQYIYIYISWPTVVESDSKAPFSKGARPRCMGGRYLLLRVASLSLDPYFIMLNVK